MADESRSHSVNAVLLLVGVAVLFALFATAGQPMHFRADSVTGSNIAVPAAPLPPPPPRSASEILRSMPPIPGVVMAPPGQAAPAPAEVAAVPPQPGQTVKVAPPPPLELPAPPPPPAQADEDQKASIDKDDVQQAMRTLLPQFKGCYAQALAHDPALPGGKVVVEFTLARDTGAGSVPTEGSIPETTLNKPLIEACILDKLRTAKFPEMKGEGTVKVRYPLRFSPDADGGA